MTLKANNYNVFKDPKYAAHTNDPKGEALLEAIVARDIETVRRALVVYPSLADEGVLRWNDMWSPLAKAADVGCADCVRALLAAGASIDRRQGLATAAWHAASAGHVECLSILADAGADLDIGTDDKWGATPLISAADAGEVEVVRVLARRGAALDAQISSGHTAAHSAAMWGHVDVLHVLSAAGASLTIRSDRGSTPLSAATKNGRGPAHRTLVALISAKEAAKARGQGGAHGHQMETPPPARRLPTTDASGRVRSEQEQRESSKGEPGNQPVSPGRGFLEYICKGVQEKLAALGTASPKKERGGDGAHPEPDSQPAAAEEEAKPGAAGAVPAGAADEEKQVGFHPGEAASRAEGSPGSQTMREFIVEMLSDQPANAGMLLEVCAASSSHNSTM